MESREKFEVELRVSTFPDSTKTETPRKLLISLTFVCLSVESFSDDILRPSVVTLDLESRTYLVQSDNYFLLIWGGGDFRNSLNSYI